MRLYRYLNENKGIKAGDWVEGTAQGKLMDQRVRGIFISDIDEDFSLIATWQPRGKIKKKLYTRILDIEPTSKPSDAPKDLMKFAKKHSMYR